MRQLRERLLNTLLVVSTFISTILYILAWVPAIQANLIVNIPIYTVLYISLVLITFFRRMPYNLRVAIWLIIIYSLGIFNLYLNGFNVDAGLFFLLLIAVTFLLIGLQSGVLAFIVCSMTIAIMSFLIVQGTWEPPMNLPQTNPMLWVVGGIIFVLTGVILILSLRVLISGLEAQLVQMQSLLEGLQEAKAILEAKDRRFDILLQGSTDMIALLDKDGTIRYASPSVERMLGYGVEEVLGKKVFDYLHQEDLAAAVRAMMPGIPPEEIGPYLELRLRHKSGAWRMLEVVGRDIYQDPAVNGTVVNCRDITDRKQIEAELRAAQKELELIVAQQQHEIDTYSERLAQMVRHSPVVIYGYGYSEPRGLPFISENIFQLTGYEASNFLNDTHLWLSYIHPDDREQANEGFRNDLEERGYATREYRFLHKDGQYRWFREETRRIMEKAHTQLEFVGLVVDITEQKQTEAAYATLVESSMQGVLLSQDGKAIFANRSLCDSLGLSMREVENLTAEQTMKHLHPEDFYNFDNIRRILRGLSEEDAAPAQFDVRWIRTGGDVRWLEIHVNRMDYRGRPAFQIIALDITERKQAELSLMESEKINRLLLETTQDIAILFDKDAMVLACNATGARALGYPIEYLKTHSMYDLKSPVATILRVEKFEEVLRTGVPLSFEDCRAGRWYVNNFYPVLDGEGCVTQIAVFATNITRRKEMEEELRLQKEKLETEVAIRTRELRVLSHELIRAQEVERHRVSRELHDEAGQLLVELGLSLDSVYDEIPKEQRAIRKNIRNVRDLVSRVTRSTRSLARSLRPPALEIAGLNTVLQDLCAEFSDFSNLVVSYHGQEIELPDVVSISLYRFVQEALTNVVKHASASNVEVRLGLHNGHVTLMVSDNGKGMDQGKQAGGLGLLGIQERAALLGGWVDIQSSQNGTSLTISVPMDEMNGEPGSRVNSRQGEE